MATRAALVTGASSGIGLAIAVVVILVLLTGYFQSPRLAIVSIGAVPGVVTGVAAALVLLSPFVPMLFSDNNGRTLTQHHDVVLAFNEPDLKGQATMTVDGVLEPFEDFDSCLSRPVSSSVDQCEEVRVSSAVVLGVQPHEISGFPFPVLHHGSPGST